LIAVDANVLVYSANQDLPEHPRCREHGVDRIYSRETDFRRFPLLEIVDPFEVEP
jgi:predicted nucleic acid-binding protein